MLTKKNEKEHILYGPLKNSDANNIYYEITVPNLSSSYIPCQFQETRQQPYITNTQDWEVAITAFNIPSSAIPLFIFQNPSTPPLYNAGYWISISTDTNAAVSIPVLYDPPQSQKLNTAIQQPPPYNSAIFNYTLFLEQINIAFLTLWLQLVALGQIPAGKMSPFIAFYPETQLFKLYVDSSLEYYDGTNYTTSIKIFLNFNLMSYFWFPSQYQNVPNGLLLNPPLDYLILFTQVTYIAAGTGANFVLGGVGSTITFNKYELSQEYSTLAQWAQYQRILFFSNNIPVYNKEIGDATNLGNDQSFNVLMDFNIDDNAVYNRSLIQYDDGATLKWISLRAVPAIRTIDMNVQFMGTSSNDIFPCYITPNTKFSVTIWFRRKEQMVRSIREIDQIFDMNKYLEWLKEHFEKEEHKKSMGGQVSNSIFPQSGVTTLIADGDDINKHSYQADRAFRNNKKY